MFIEKLSEALSEIIFISKEEIQTLIIKNDSSEHGDFSFPCFTLSKNMKKAPNIIASELANTINLPECFLKCENVGPYLNFYVRQEIFTQYVLTEIKERKSTFGSSQIGKGKTCLLEHTSINPNASPHIGRARYENLGMLFLNRDIPPARRGEFRTYSNEELKRLNAAIVEMDEQTARIMIIHQMLGTRISDTLTLETDCLYEKEENIIIRIRQMKSSTYEKPISAELAQLIRMAITYTREKYGETKYIFVNDKDSAKPLQYGTIQSRIVKMIHEKDIRDDNGNLFGFGSHLYRHYYSVKLSEMHLDDWTIAQLLGHRSVRNVKYYRKMSNQALADDTREVLKMLSDQMKESLDGWEEEYEQIRQNGGM